MATELDAAEIEAQSEEMTHGTLSTPSFLMCPPYSISSDEPNNPWMEEYEGDAGVIDKRRALAQFMNLYQYVSAEALVYLLPAPCDTGLQDLVYVANLAFVPEHIPGRNTVIISKYTSKPRIGEEVWGRRFFETMGYRVIDCPFRFEGEAEIKHLYDNVYVGGYGNRSQIEAFRWMEGEFDMKVVTVEEADPHLYHLDCSVFPVTEENTVVCTEILRPEEVAELEKVTNIIDVSADIAYSGICNSVRLHNVILNASNLYELKKGSDDYRFEIEKNRKLEDIAVAVNCEIAYFNLSEFYKSGALLSCTMLHLNRFSNSMRLV